MGENYLILMERLYYLKTFFFQKITENGTAKASKWVLFCFGRSDSSLWSCSIILKY